MTIYLYPKLRHPAPQLDIEVQGKAQITGGKGTLTIVATGTTHIESRYTRSVIIDGASTSIKLRIDSVIPWV